MPSWLAQTIRAMLPADRSVDQVSVTFIATPVRMWLGPNPGKTTRANARPPCGGPGETSLAGAAAAGSRPTPS
ncbi:hypothetical protein Ntsu_74780 [Nocardia sp. IFM 10818]